MDVINSVITFLFMKASIRTIGKSKGLIIPKKILEECGIDQEVTLTVKNQTLVVKPLKDVKDWSDFKSKKQSVAFMPNEFDQTEWTW